LLCNYLCKFNVNNLENRPKWPVFDHLEVCSKSHQVTPGVAWSDKNCPQYQASQVTSSHWHIFDKFSHLQIRLIKQAKEIIEEKALSGSYTNDLFERLNRVPPTLFMRWGQVVSPMNAKIMGGFLFGVPSEDPGLKEAMKVLGLSHLFAASGANVSLVLSFFGRFRDWPRKWRFFSRVATVGLYWLLAGAGVSLSRAVVMAILGFLARDLIQRQVSNLRILAFLAIFVFFFVPAWFESLSFQLSTAATAALVLAATARSPSVFFPSPVLASPSLPSRALRWGWQQLTLSAITTFGTWPIVGLHFGEINWLGIGVSAAAGTMVELLTFAAATLMLIEFLFSFFAPFVGALIQSIYSSFVGTLLALAANELVRHGTWSHAWSLIAAVGWVIGWVGVWIIARVRQRRRAVNNWCEWHET
jgi:ComEC/Rec2-related protein